MQAKHLRFCLLLILLLLPAMTAAQDNWQIAVFDAGANHIAIVTAEGITNTIAIPAFNGQNLKVTAISPDYRYAAGFLPGTSEYLYLPALADLERQTCCLMFDVPENESFFTQFSNFAADNTIILSTNNYDWQNNTGGGLVFLIDAVSGMTVKQKQLDVFAYPGDWDGTDFYYLDAPLGGTEWLPVGNYSVWETDTDAVTKSSTRYALFRGDVLESTGEAVDAVYNDQLPLPYPDYMIPPGNTTAYYPADVNAANFENFQVVGGKTIFFSPRLLDSNAAWVRNGDAALAYSYQYDLNTGNIHGAFMSAIFRTGAVLDVDVVVGQRFLVGTPEGWLMEMLDTHELMHYIATETGYHIDMLGDFSGEITLLTEPELNPTMPGTFPEFVLPPATTPQNAPQCPGVLPSRLQVGEMGWVLPGEPNNLRSSPTTSGEQIGQLQGSVAFTVLEGPVCADNYAWWRVRDGYGMEGWTAEGNSNEYWIAPLN